MKRSTGSKELHLQPGILTSKPFSEPEVVFSHPPDGVSDIKKRHQAEFCNLETFIFTTFICFYWWAGNVFILWNYFWMAAVQKYFC